MDPVTVVGLAASVAQLIDVTAKTILYLNGVKDASKARAKLAQEVSCLLTFFNNLRCRLEESNPTDPWFQRLRALGGKCGPLEDFKATLEDLSQRLAPNAGAKKLGQALVWSFEKKEIDSVLLKFERLKSHIHLALEQDHLYVSILRQVPFVTADKISKLSEEIKKDVSVVTVGVENMRINDESA